MLKSKPWHRKGVLNKKLTEDQKNLILSSFLELIEVQSKKKEEVVNSRAH